MQLLNKICLWCLCSKRKLLGKQKFSVRALQAPGKPWMTAIADFGAQAMNGRQVYTGALM